MISKQPLLTLNTQQALGIVIILVAMMGFTIIQLEWVPHLTILTALLALLAYGMMRGIHWNEMQKRMAQSVEQGMGAVYLFFFYWVTGFVFDDEWGDSNLDVLRFWFDFTAIFLFIGIFIVWRDWRIHWQQLDDLRDSRRGVYGYGRSLWCERRDYRRSSGIRCIFWR